MITICTPTRGLIFTETAKAISDVLLHVEGVVLYSWNLTIPEAHNYLVENALLMNPTHILFIEEDNVPTRQGIQNLFNSDADIACLDYGVEGYSCTAKTRKGEILWCGMGVTLIKAEVFRNLERPWFRSDKSLRLNDWKWVDNPSKYGGQDIWFCTKAREKGYKIVQVEGEARHLKLESLGRIEYNKGLHVIKDKPKISKQQYVEGGIN